MGHESLLAGAARVTVLEQTDNGREMGTGGTCRAGGRELGGSVRAGSSLERRSWPLRHLGRRGQGAEPLSGGTRCRWGLAERVGCDARPPATVDPEVRSGPVSRAAHNHDPESAPREA